MKKLIVSLLALVAISAAFAIPGYYTGTSGSVTVPNAKITDKIVLNSYFYQDSEFMFPNIEAAMPLETVPGLEISGAYHDANDFQFNTLGGKYVLPYEMENIKFALGGYYSNLFDSEVYLAGTYNFADFDLDLSAVVSYSLEGDGIGYGASLEKNFGIATLGVEYTKVAQFKGGDAVFNVYGTADVDKNFYITLGLIDVANESIFGGGVGYKF